MFRFVPLLALLTVGLPAFAQGQACDGVAVALDDSGAKGVVAELERGRANGSPLRPTREDEPLWCSAADDPRCAPLQTSSTPLGGDLRVGAALHADAQAYGPQARMNQGFTACGGIPAHAGVHVRVERPPR